MTELRLGAQVLLLAPPGRVWPTEMACHRVNSHRIGAVLHAFRQHRHEISRLRQYWHRHHLREARLSDEALLCAFATAVADGRVVALVLPRGRRVVSQADASSMDRPAVAGVPPPSPASSTGTAPEKSFTQWDLSDRLGYVLTEAAKNVPGDIGDVLRGFLTPEGLAWLVLFVGLEAASHAAGGVGFIADAALAGLLWGMCGVSAIYGMVAFADFMRHTVAAESKADLDLASKDLARAAVLFGVAALTFLGARAKARAVGGRIRTAAAAGESDGAAAGGGRGAGGSAPARRAGTVGGQTGLPAQEGSSAAAREAADQAGSNASQAAELPKGARGPSTGRDFDPEKAGGPIAPKSLDDVQITHETVDQVEAHTSRFGADPHNEAMLLRQRAIADGKLEATLEDKAFHAHEIDEYQRYQNLGFKEGLPEDSEAQAELWNNTHTAALEDYSMPEIVRDPVTGKMRSTLYHPSCDPRLLPEGWTPPPGYPFNQ